MKIRSGAFWAGTAAAGAFPVALLLAWIDLRLIADLWDKCELDDASGGITFNFVVFPMVVGINFLLVPAGALLFAKGHRLAMRLIGRGWAPDSALGLVIPVGVVVMLAASALASVLAISAANAQIPPDYPTSCVELGNGNA
ncbi:hypothetical protein [Saccharopolyspora antimicrobica]|uniref:hypothetical protein n=1 Tax=Saccharopolyspora antimicrobica TaxID=455193 RepID=UPI000B8139AE|nr:hypothetical protein [Saccharopolyspora antimicrobica]